MTEALRIEQKIRLITDRIINVCEEEGLTYKEVHILLSRIRCEIENREKILYNEVFRV